MQAEIVQLAKYRLDKASECLSDAQVAFEEDRLANSINRSYYAVFHATRALLALDSFDSKKHSTIIGYFNQHYIATGKIEVVYYQQLSNAFRIRNKTDYDDKKITLWLWLTTNPEGLFFSNTSNILLTNPAKTHPKHRVAAAT